MNILFVVTCPFPLGEASSIRAVNIVRMIAAAGHNVHVIADTKGIECIDTPCTYEWIAEKVKSLRDRKKIAQKSVETVMQYCSTNHVDIILMNARYDRYDAIQRFCHSHGKKLIVESCEWYHFGNFRLKFLDPRFLQNQKMILCGFKKADGFISISRYLDAYNRKLGKPSVRIPTIMDIASVQVGKGSGKERIQVVYTGNPGTTKEYLAPMINLLADKEDIRNRIQFHIYGPNYKQVLKNKGVKEKQLAKAKDSVVIHGRIPQQEIPKVLMSADYQLILRPNRRSSNAGFPTKLAESMAVGTPIIANLTGDIGMYLVDEINGFVCKEVSIEAMKSVFTSIVSKSESERHTMREKARLTAENAFDYRKYIDDLKELVSVTKK